ncbi:hypothetical protein HMPREF3039_00961 [Akkermansia sp. KLE1798]|nr:hypothetical protein HMPREF3039_00961 [Akkermansia sp. KLE1798]KZA06202.1 hypothetical protein HMPREF1326_00050 [Akkermansia sp. KLE1605]
MKRGRNREPRKGWRGCRSYSWYVPVWEFVSLLPAAVMAGADKVLKYLFQQSF